ncbi:transposase [Streptomyces sp. CB01201]|uniref:transposase n=1 Tax=Streptomyces sp. CB01201 TaxID=2020324 RepID=UPI000D19EC3F
MIGSSTCGPIGGAQKRTQPRRPSTPGSRHHVVTDAQGIPLTVSLTGGNRNDVTQLLPLIDKIPAVFGVVGRPDAVPTPSSPTAATTTTNTAVCSGLAASVRSHETGPAVWSAPLSPLGAREIPPDSGPSEELRGRISSACLRRGTTWFPRRS